ncbi:beta-1,6-N-acetylglucosaminyltransferase [Herbaspirillum lusitanum]|uniref:Peptide O-xylosyltransferase n=1 Tax=Herbaspirillum lusitanum TaxID=213312 RepID=A0ABW9A7L8_9BURK
MKIAYLILAHNNAKLLGRLIEELSGEQNSFFLHIDLKADINAFAALRAYPNVHFCEQRVDGAWGDFSLVQGTLNVMQQAMQFDPEFERVVLLSGSTLPVQPSGYIEDFFAKNPESNYVEAYAMPNEQYGKSLGRLEHYWLRRTPPMLSYKWKAQDFIIAHAPRRNYKRAFGDMQPIAGSQWWAMTGKACQYVLDFVRDNQRFCRFCHHTDCADEFFFQTILWNSPFRASLLPSITYTDWKPGSSSPNTINEEHLRHFAQARVTSSVNCNSPLPQSEVLFARKFDEKPWGPIEQLLASNHRKSKPSQIEDLGQAQAPPSAPLPAKTKPRAASEADAVPASPSNVC